MWREMLRWCVFWYGNLSSSGKPGVRVLSMLSVAFAELFSVCVCVCTTTFKAVRVKET